MTKRFYRLGVIPGLLMVALALTGGCGDDDNNNNGWECGEGYDGWEKCAGDQIQYCHLVAGMDPHFHNGRDCGDEGLTCVAEADTGEAFCVDMSVDCTAGSFRCEDNTAYNCIDGHEANEPCGTGVCHEHADEAHCETQSLECDGHGHLESGECHCDTGYVQDPDDPLSCISEVPFPQQACDNFQNETVEQKSVTPTFADVFAPDYHADLDVPVEVTLPAGDSYIHFPIMETGAYVLFLDTVDVFDSAYDRFETALNVTGGVPNGMCETVLTDHYHIDATLDASQPPVPGVLKFNTSTANTTVRFIIMLHEEHD